MLMDVTDDGTVGGAFQTARKWIAEGDGGERRLHSLVNNASVGRWT